MVSRAFNPNARIAPEKRMMVLELAEKYGFSPNKHASRLSMKPINIGIILSSRFDVNTQNLYDYCFPKKTNHKYMPYFD